MIFAALNEAAERGELLLSEDGLCRFHRRRDGRVTIREIVVLPDRRRQGTGRALVERVASRCPGAVIVARCPTCYPANGFWPRVGFLLVGEEKGCKVWERRG